MRLAQTERRQYILTAVILFLPLCFLLVPLKSKSTCIIIHCQGNRIIAVADTRSNLFSKDGKSKGSIILQKIHRVNNIFFAISGHYDQHIYFYALKALQQHANLDDAINTEISSTVVFFDSAMKAEKKSSPDSYKKWLITPVAAVAFFGFNQVNPFIVRIIFFMKEENGIPKIYPIVHNDRTTVALGVYEHIETKIPQVSPQPQYSLSEKDLVNLVLEEQKHHPNDVSCPIDILTVTATNNALTRQPCK